MAITVRRSTMVRPARETPRRRLWNSHLDLLVPRFHTPSVYFYRPSSSCTEKATGFFDGGRMQRALTEALVAFYPMAGRLGRDKDGRVEIDCNGEGVLFVEAEAADATVADYGDFAPSMELKRLIPPVDYTDDISSFPLVVLQVTYFKCGGVSLGVGTQHHVADGMSGLHFINSWSDLCRGDKIKVMPFIDRTLVSGRDPPTPFYPHVSTIHPQPCCHHHPCPCPRISLLIREHYNLQLQLAVWTSSRSDIARLRSKLPKDDGGNGDGPRFSTYTLLSAHVWRCVSLARGLPSDQPTKLYCAIDGRQRLKPPMPDGFLGNVLFTATPIVEAGKVTGGLLSDAAKIIQAEIDKMDDAYCRSALDYLELQPDVSALVRSANNYRCPNLGITSWVNLPVYDADFGWGRPVFMGPGAVAFEGLAYVLPSADKDGSLSVAISLQAHHMNKFRNLISDI